MICRLVSLVLLLNCQLLSHAWAETKKDLGLQLAENPPMQVIARTPPAPAPLEKDFEIRDGFTLIETLDKFRDVIKNTVWNTPR